VKKYNLGDRFTLQCGTVVELVAHTDPRVGHERSWSVCLREAPNGSAKTYEDFRKLGRDSEGTEAPVAGVDYWVKYRPAVPADDKAPILTTDKQARKQMPMARGLVDYFPRALAAVANVSFVANEQHNPGQPMHWAKGKSTDHADCIMRHLVERGGIDDDKLRHSAKLAWRALALLETELTEGT
jgi:hypothetical protein